MAIRFLDAQEQRDWEHVQLFGDDYGEVPSSLFLDEWRSKRAAAKKSQFMALPLAAFALGQMSHLAGPVIHQALSDFRLALGYNDLSQARNAMMLRNYRSTLRRPYGTNSMPVHFELAERLKLFNQGPWHRAYNDEGKDAEMWEDFRARLKWLGIDMNLVDRFGPGGIYQWDSPGQAREWYQLLEMSGGAAPLTHVIANYYRSKPLPAARQMVSEDELNYNMQRAELRRKEDRDTFLNSFYAWQPDEITRLAWMGVVDVDTEYSMRRAAGITRTEDLGFRDYLENQMPPPNVLMEWAKRRMWDGDLARRYSLDEGLDMSPLASFFAQAQGMRADNRPLPNQPNGETDWLKMSYRSTRPLPSYAELKSMQHRLRISPRADGFSVIPGVDAWTSDNTRDVLRMQGLPEPFVQRLSALVPTPLTVTQVHMVLGNVLEHPAVRREAERIFVDEGDWVKNALLDDGLSDPHATIAAIAIRQEASDKANAELIAHKHRIREEKRKQAIERYNLGTITRFEARELMIHHQYPEDLADKELDLVDQGFKDDIANTKLKSLHDAWMSGHLNEQAIRGQMQLFNIRPERRDQYIELWRWERNANLRTLTTGEILSALKSGVVTPAVAQQRLVNLGWAGSDAMIEIAQVQHELQVSQSKAIATQAGKVQAAQIAAGKARAAAALKQQHAAALAKVAKAKLTHQEVRSIHAKLMHDNQYFKAVHLANSAYAHADKAGDQEKMAGELAREVADYHKWQLAQIDLAAIAPEVAREIGPRQTIPAQGPHPSQGANGSPSNPSSSSGGPGGADSGTAPQAGPGQAVP